MYIYIYIYIYVHVNTCIVDIEFENAINDNAASTTGSICNILCSLASYRLDTVMDSSDVTHSSYEQTDSMPEQGEHNSHRICCSLFAQLISRFFVVEAIPASSPPATTTSSLYPSNPASKPSSPTHQQHQHNLHQLYTTSNNFIPGQMCNKLDPSCFRTEMYSRIRVFRQTGCDAFLAHLLITETDKQSVQHNKNVKEYQQPTIRSVNSTLTIADKQFVLWTLREVLVSCIEVDNVYAKDIFMWLAWMLRGGCKEKPKKDDYYERQQFDTKKSSFIDTHNSLVSADGSKSSSIAPVPSSSPVIGTYLRIILTQELRLFLGGDHWESVLPKHVSAMPSKILLIPWVTDIKRGEHVGDVGHDDDSSVGGIRESHGRSSRIMKDINKNEHHYQPHHNATAVLMCNMACRVPISGTYAASLMIDMGIVEVLIDLLMGSTCNPQIRRSINCNDKSATYQDESYYCKDDELEEWWGVLTLFCYMLNTSEDAKDRVEKYVGLEDMIKFLLPIAQNSCKFLKISHKGIVNTLLALCVSGASLSPSSRPFIYCRKLLNEKEEKQNPDGCITLSNNVSDDIPWLLKTYNERKDKEGMKELVAGVEESSLSLLSPAYLTDGRSISMMLSVIRPCITRLENYYKQSGRDLFNSRGSQKDENSEKRDPSNGDTVSHHRAQRHFFTSFNVEGSVKNMNEQSSVGDVAFSDVDFNELETRSIGGGTRSSYHSLHALGKIER